MDIINTLGYQLFEILKQVRTNTDKSAKGLGLTRTQWQVFASFEILGNPTTQQALLSQLDIDKAHLARVIDGLVKNGFLLRNPLTENRRVTELSITTKGDSIMKSINRLMVQQHKKMSQNINLDSLTSFEKTLKQISINLK